MRFGDERSRKVRVDAGQADGKPGSKEKAAIGFGEIDFSIDCRFGRERQRTLRRGKTQCTDKTGPTSRAAKSCSGLVPPLPLPGGESLTSSWASSLRGEPFTAAGRMGLTGVENLFLRCHQTLRSVASHDRDI